MADRSLDVRILRRGRKQDEFNIQADPENAAAMRDELKNWLRGHGWTDERRWGEFEAEIRFADENKVRAKVRI